jgi:hypothetical protein
LFSVQDSSFGRFDGELWSWLRRVIGKQHRILTGAGYGYIREPSKGNKVDPAELGIEHEAIDGAYDVTIFEDLGSGQTKLTFIGNEPMESAKNSGQMEGWIEILDKVAAVVAGLVQAK